MKHMIHLNLSQQQQKKSAPSLECLFIQWSQNIDARKAKTKGGWGVARELLHKREIIIISRLPTSVLTLHFSAFVAFALNKKKKKEYYK